jgi:outer membrane protein assembly factor BamB
MKRIFFISIIIVVLASLLSSCGGGPVINSWPGISVDTNSNTIYVAYQSSVFAVQSNGTMKWRYPEKADNNRQYYAPPVLTPDGQLIISGYDAKLYSLNPASGQLNKIFFEGGKGRYIDGPAVGGDGLYVPCSDEILYATDLQGGKRWSFNSGQALWSKPAIKENTLYLSSMNRNLYALNAKDGNVIWKQDAGGAIVSTPALSEDGILYVGTFSKEILAFDPTGKNLWRTPIEGWIWSTPAISGGVLYVGDINGTLYAINRTNGKVSWKITPDSASISGTPLVLKEKIYFTTQAGNFYAVDLNGNVLWNRAVGGKIYNGPIEANDQVLVAPVGIDPILLAFDSEGNQKWTFAPPK